MPRAETQQNNLVTEAYKSMTEAANVASFGGGIQFDTMGCHVNPAVNIWTLDDKKRTSSLTATIKSGSTQHSGEWKKVIDSPEDSSDHFKISNALTKDVEKLLKKAADAYDKTITKGMEKLGLKLTTK